MAKDILNSQIRTNAIITTSSGPIDSAQPKILIYDNLSLATRIAWSTAIVNGKLTGEHMDHKRNTHATQQEHKRYSNITRLEHGCKNRTPTEHT